MSVAVIRAKRRDDQARPRSRRSARSSLPVASIQVNLADLLEALPRSERRATLDMVDWLLGSSSRPVDLSVFTEAIGQRLLALDLPIDRVSLIAQATGENTQALDHSWSRDAAIAQEGSPFRSVQDLEKSLAARLRAATPIAGHCVELSQGDLQSACEPECGEGGQDDRARFLCIPVIEGDDHDRVCLGWLVLASLDLKAFTPAERTKLQVLMPRIAARLARRFTQLFYRRLLRTYVGDEPHRAILEGATRRGQVVPIRSAFLFADMRDSLGHTADPDLSLTVGLLNDFFECLVPPIETRGGEVLKFIGDGLLAIFRQKGDHGADAADRALAAARHAMSDLVRFNETRPDRRPIELGIGLHYGHAAYGNIGSGQRLDFTVVGRDVGMASRVGDLTGQLTEPLLMSAAFAEQVSVEGDLIGAFTVSGLSQPITVFRLDQNRSEKFDADG